MSSLAQGDDKVTKDLLYIGQADVNAVDESGNTVLKYSFVSPAARKLHLAVEGVPRGPYKQHTMDVLLGHHHHHNNNNNNNGEALSALPALSVVVDVEGNDRNMSQVLQGAADVTTCDSDGNYPLHWLGRGVSVDYTFKGRTVRLTNPVKTSIGAQQKGYHVSRGSLLCDKGEKNK